LYTDLLTLLHEMVSHYRRLLALSQQEQEILTASSLPMLLESTIQKETLILELAVMEEGRQLLHRKLAEQHAVPLSELTLERLSGLAPQPYAAGFQRCRTELVQLVHAIGQVNAHNTILVSTSLDCTRASLGLLSRLLEPPPTYGSDGHLDATGRGGTLLYKRV